LNDLRSDYQTFMNILKPIAVKRVSGTPENEMVRKVSVKSIRQQIN